MNQETAWAAEKVALAKREFAEARLATRLAFNAARVPPDGGRVPDWEALPPYLRAALEAEDEKASRLIAAVDGFLPLAAAERHGDAGRMLTSIPMLAAPEVHVPRAAHVDSTVFPVPGYLRVDVTARASGTIRAGVLPPRTVTTPEGGLHFMCPCGEPGPRLGQPDEIEGCE